MGSRKLQQSKPELIAETQHSAKCSGPTIRNYPSDSPQAAARVLALALLADGAIHSSELRALARSGILQRLGIDQAAFESVIDDLCADLQIETRSSGCLKLGKDALRHILEDIGQRSLQQQLLRSVLDIIHADGKLVGCEAVLLSLAAECWDIDPFDSYRILAKPERRGRTQVLRASRSAGHR